MPSTKRAAPPGHIIWDRPGYLVRRLHQIHVALFIDHVADGGVTPIQYGLLSILVSRPNIDQFTIGEELGLDRDQDFARGGQRVDREQSQARRAIEQHIIGRRALVLRQ